MILVPVMDKKEENIERTKMHQNELNSTFTIDTEVNETKYRYNTLVTLLVKFTMVYIGLF
jgi:hypothetical protein